MKKYKVKIEDKEIILPIYGYDESEHDDIEGDEYVYDWEEIADELENRISKKLGKNVLITISDVEDEEGNFHTGSLHGEAK